MWQNNEAFPLELNKVVTVWHNKALLQMDYELKNVSGREISFLFAVEFNFGLQAGQAEDRYYYDTNGRLEHSYLNSLGVLPSAKMIGLKDEYLKINIQVSSELAKEIWRLPVETISLSESGFERVYQSSTVLVVHQVKLQKSIHFSLNQLVQQIEND